MISHYLSIKETFCSFLGYKKVQLFFLEGQAFQVPTFVMTIRQKNIKLLGKESIGIEELFYFVHRNTNTLFWNN